MFDEQADVEEVHNLALDPAYANIVQELGTKPTAMLDPTQVANQARRAIDDSGRHGAVP
ncbi:MAG: hypothetical protein H5U08_08390 [Thermogutta sp.]|nr:hypothetical protein [Thermogutta sp.]